MCEKQHEWQVIDEATRALNTKKGVVIKSINPDTGFESMVFVTGEHWKDGKFETIILL